MRKPIEILQITQDKIRDQLCDVCLGEGIKCDWRRLDNGNQIVVCVQCEIDGYMIPSMWEIIKQ